MQTTGLKIVTLVTLAASLSGCGVIMGPDLATRPSPFHGAVTMTDDEGHQVAALTPSDQGDTAVVDFSGVNGKPVSFKANITYRAFVPIVAETNAERRDYWLIGFNASQTADRSYYIVLRYPHAQPLAVHTTAKAELKVLVCDPPKRVAATTPSAQAPADASATSDPILSEGISVCLTEKDAVYAAALDAAKDTDDWTQVTITTP